MALILLVLLALQASPPVMRVVKPSRPDAGILQNGGFEQLRDDTVDGWQAWQKGFRAVLSEVRGGSRAIACENRGQDGEFGASQTLALNRTSVAPLVIRGWSRAQEVTGSPDSGYSLYADLVYDDGTSLWGQTADFRCGTHDWEQREFVIVPEKPVRSLTLHCLFRGHAGKVWFDDVTVEEQAGGGDTVQFQGVPVQVTGRGPRAASPAGQPARQNASPAGNVRGTKTVATRDGLRLVLQDNSVTSLRVGERELAGSAPSGFLVRDVAANSDVYAFDHGACPELGLKLQAEFTARSDHIVVSGRVSDTSGRDRAVTLLFALPVDADGWQWGDDIRRSRRIEGRTEFANTTGVRCGATGTMALYPLAPVYDNQTGLALALDMGRPAQYRLSYHAGTRQSLIAYDFGLVKESERFPSSADFRFVLYHFDPRWGFRAAFQKLVGLFPAYFTVRSRDQGIWMPFTDISTVTGWQDFGFKYHEGNNNVAFDDAGDILSFRYTEPMTWWMPMKPEVARTEPEALRVREEWATGTDAERRRMAIASRSAGMTRADGSPSLLFRKEPWCDGAVWSLNPNPHLPGEWNAATVHWNETIRRSLYGSAAKGRLDGEYMDSLEGYVTAELNFRRDQFCYTTVPLTFASDTKQPALFKGLAVYEFTRWIAEDVHRLGKLTFANGVPFRFPFLCPWLDVMGTETDWARGGQYRPASDAQMSLWRTMAYQKPYVLLMNTDYDSFPPEMVEKYFQRSLFYGIFPSMFSHNAAENPYWQNPKWYNRDRPLFRRYLPLIKRIAEAGWQPVTAATCDNAGILVERFGPDAGGAIYLTVLNDTPQVQRGTLTLDAASLKLPRPFVAQEMLSSRVLAPDGARLGVELQSQETWLVRIVSR